MGPDKSGGGSDCYLQIFFYLLLALPVSLSSHSCHPFEVFAEEAGVRESHFFSNLSNRLVRMSQFDFDMCDNSLVDPFFGSCPAHLSDDCAQITLCEAHAFGIIRYLVFVLPVLVDKCDESVEDGLLMRLRTDKLVSMLAVESVVVIHECCNERTDGLHIVVVLMNDMPQGVDDAVGCFDVGISHFDLEVAHLSVESRWHLSCSKRHREIGKQSDAVNLYVVGESDGIDDGAWS